MSPNSNQGSQQRPSAPSIIQSRCVHSHVPEALCRLCQYACPTDAIILDDKKASVIADACIRCGVCAGVCPTGAILPVHRSTQLVWSSVLQATVVYGSACLACARSGILGTSESIVALPCLGSLPPEFYFKVAADAPDTCIYLPKGLCDGCPVSTGGELLASSIADAEKWSKSTIKIVRDLFDLPFSALSGDTGEVDRRGLFTDITKRARGGMAHASENDAATQLELRKARMRDSTAASRRAKRQRDARFEESKRSGKFRRNSRTETVRRSLLEDVLEAHQDLAESTLIDTVYANMDACTRCGECVKNCPLGALFLGDGDIEVDDLCCTGCGLCIEICPTGALQEMSMDAAGLVAPYDPDDDNA